MSWLASMARRVRGGLVLMLVLGAAGGCGPDTKAEPVVVAPVEPGPADCAVCGMTVRDQPSPRGQVLHRGGAHKHFCSLGDLRAYLQTPNALGKPVGVWVEDLGPGFDPLAFDVAVRPYVPAETATYVVGTARPRIMGLPVLSFADPAHAGSHVTGRAHTAPWTALTTTPFHDIPPETP